MVAVFREVWRVLKPTGTVWLNLGDSYAGSGKGLGSDRSISKNYVDDAEYGKRVAVPNGLKPKDLVGIPWRVAFTLQADGWYLRSDIIWSKPNSMPEGVQDRPTKAHEYIFLLTKNARYYYDTDAIQEITGANKRSVWAVNTHPYPEAHFATYPEKLVEPCIMAGCPLGGVVLDPFAGSGTTMAVAQRLGRRGIGTDLSTEYLALASKRLGSIALPMNLGM
jgi:DNA modification methylase